LKPRTKKAKRKKTRSSKKRSGRLSLKKAAKTVAKMLWVHLVKLPEEEREEGIALIERAFAKRLKKILGHNSRKSKARNT
jgi:hypothetical protein